jgi:hypothetical protein
VRVLALQHEVAQTQVVELPLARARPYGKLNDESARLGNVLCVAGSELSSARSEARPPLVGSPTGVAGCCSAVRGAPSRPRRRVPSCRGDLLQRIATVACFDHRWKCSRGA